MDYNIGNLDNELLAKLKIEAEQVLNGHITDFEWERCVSRFRIIETSRDLTIDDIVGHVLKRQPTTWNQK